MADDILTTSRGPIAGILGGQAADGGPIELFAALGEEAQKPVMQQAPSGIGTRRVSAAASARRMSLYPSGAAKAAGSNFPSAIRSP